MARQVDISIDLGSANTGLVATLRAQLVNSAGTLNGSAVSMGFIEVGNGLYLWNYSAVPDAFRGGVSFYLSSSIYTDPLAFISLVAVVDTLEALDSAGAVWDEARSGHATAGTFGEGVQAESLNTQAKADVNEQVDAALVDYDGLTTSDATQNKDDIIEAIPTASENADAVREELAVELARIDKPISECCPDQAEIEITQGDTSPDRSFRAG